MDKQKPISRNKVLYAIVGFLGLLAFITCIAAELTKNQEKDLKLDTKFCHLPKSPAFGLGITALVCLLCAQVIGYVKIANNYFKRSTKAQFGDRTTAVSITLTVLSWATLALAILLLGVASSMNQTQPYGEGWLDGECYIVRKGVYSGASVLAIVTVACTLAVYYAETKRHEGLAVVVVEEARLPTAKNAIGI